MRTKALKNPVYESWRKGVRLNRWFASLTLDEQRQVLRVRRATADNLTATWNAMTDDEKTKVMKRHSSLGVISNILISDNTRYDVYKEEYKKKSNERALSWYYRNKKKQQQEGGQHGEASNI